MRNQKQYVFLIDEIEALLSFIGPVNDSLIDMIPPLYDEIQEVMPDKLFAETAPLLKECRKLISRYKVEGAEEAPAILDLLSVSISKVKQTIRRYDLTIEYGASFDRSYRERA